MTDIAIVSEPHHVNCLENIAKGTVAATSNNLKHILLKNGIDPSVPKLRDYSDDVFIKWMKLLPYEMKKNGVDMLTAFSYDGLSYWWLMDKWLFRGDGHFDSLSDVLNAIEIVHNLIKKYNPKNITFVDDRMLYSNVIRYVCLVNNINPVPIPFRKINIKKKVSEILMKRFWTISFYKRKIASRKLFSDTKHTDVLFLRGFRWERVFDYKTGETIIREPFTDQLKKKFDKSLSVGYQIGVLSEVDKPDYDTYRILENYFDKYAKRQYNDILLKLRNSFEKLSKNSRFKASFIFLGYKIWPLVERQFKRYFDIRLVGHARTHAMIKRMIENEKPKVAVSPEEVSDTARILFSVCIKNKIPCVAVQHGIFDNNILVYHEKNEASFNKLSPTLCPLPMKTCVYGQRYKDILVKKGRYPPKSVVVTGSQRFDRIINQKFSKESFHRRHSIPINKKIVAFITSPLPFNREMSIMLLEEMKKLPNVILVIKKHQGENNEFYEEIVKSVGSDAIVLPESDLYDVINAADVFVTHLSTAGLESMLFKKPVAILNLTGTEDIVAYAKEGAAVGLYKREDIVPKIEELLSKGKTYKNLLKRSDRFIKKNAFNRDGKATERIYNVIKKTMK